jgi:mono/diheme cytochrome c family protein
MHRTRSAALRGSVPRPAAALLLALALSPLAASAQDDGLTDKQRHGRQIFGQACVICHLPPVRNSATYGPALNRASAAGNDELMRTVIGNGSARMPGFKYHLKSADIDAVIAYLRTLPAPAAGQSTKGDPQ